MTFTELGAPSETPKVQLIGPSGNGPRTSADPGADSEGLSRAEQRKKAEQERQEKREQERQEKKM
eukprot:103731-Rhodomonas_salina.1